MPRDSPWLSTIWSHSTHTDRELCRICHLGKEVSDSSCEWSSNRAPNQKLDWGRSGVYFRKSLEQVPPNSLYCIVFVTQGETPQASKTRRRIYRRRRGKKTGRGIPLPSLLGGLREHREMRDRAPAKSRIWCILSVT